MSEGECGAGDAEPGGNLGGAAMEAKDGPAGEFADHFEFEPGHTKAYASAECLGAGYLGCKSGGKALSRFALAQAVSLLR